VVDVGKEEALGDGDVGGVLVGGGVGVALVGVPLAAYMGIAALLLVVPLLFSPLALLVVIPVTVTR
jgi:threonine/homoserine/homoserine lactone efflux protein